MNQMQKILEVLKEGVNQGHASKAAKSETRVQFDSKTENPFIVVFSERGFSINGTRMSFEALDDAISKQYVITLDSGQGFVLDLVAMQKILKYRNLY